MKGWKEGQRKLVYGGGAFLALTGYAFYSHADFAAFREGILVWLAAMLAAHVTQETFKKAPAP